MNKSILIFLGMTFMMSAVRGEYVEDYEAMVPFQAMGSIGIKVDSIAPDRAAGDVVPTAVHDFPPGGQTFSESPGHKFRITKTFNSVNPADYHALYICGGRSPEYIRLDKRVLKIVKHFFDTNKPVASICHGAQVLVAANVLRGRLVAAFAAVQPEVEAVGGKWKKIAVDQAFVDGNLVTSPTWLGHQEILKAFYKLLGVTFSIKKC